MKKEAAIHANLRHPNIVLMMASVFEESQYGLVLEYVIHGSLDCFLRKLSADGGFYTGLYYCIFIRPFILLAFGNHIASLQPLPDLTQY